MARPIQLLISAIPGHSTSGCSNWETKAGLSKPQAPTTPLPFSALAPLRGNILAIVEMDHFLSALGYLTGTPIPFK